MFWPKKEDREFSGDLGCFSMGRRINCFENSTLAFTKKINRHFGIMHRIKGRGGGREIALNYSSL